MSWEEAQAAPVLLHALANTMKSEDWFISFSDCLRSTSFVLKTCVFRLVLPFERHIKGEDDRPLPTSKPRKPYKRNLDSKLQKAEKKRKRSQSDRDVDPEVTRLQHTESVWRRTDETEGERRVLCLQMVTQRSPDDVCGGDVVMRPLPALWAAPSDRHYPDCAQPNRAAGSRCTSVYARLVPVPRSNPWSSPVASVGEVISPLEKKKRMAQASLSSPQGEEKERPSVIQCSQSPAQAYSSHNCNSSDGSPVPLSPMSSRSPSPYSVSSEDGTEETKDKPARGPGLPDNASDSGENKAACGEESRPSSCAEASKKGKDKSQSADSAKDSTWKSNHKMKTFQTFHPHPSFNLKSDWSPASTSSFTKVVPKCVQPLRPAPIRPPYKGPQGRPMQDDYLTCAKKLTVPWLLQIDKRDKSRTLLQKAPAAQHGQPHPAAGRPPSCALSNYDKAGRDSQQQPSLYPNFLSNRMRLPPSQLMYHHVPVGLAQSALVGYPYSYTVPQLNPQTGFFSPAVTSIYPHNFWFF